MRHYALTQLTSLARLVAVLAPLAALLAVAGAASNLCDGGLTTPRLNDIDMSASTDGEDAGVVVAELASFVDAETIFAADSALAPICAARALR